MLMGYQLNNLSASFKTWNRKYLRLKMMLSSFNNLYDIFEINSIIKTSYWLFVGSFSCSVFSDSVASGSITALYSTSVHLHSSLYLSLSCAFARYSLRSLSMLSHIDYTTRVRLHSAVVYNLFACPLTDRCVTTGNGRKLLFSNRTKIYNLITFWCFSSVQLSLVHWTARSCFLAWYLRSFLSLSYCPPLSLSLSRSAFVYLSYGVFIVPLFLSVGRWLRLKLGLQVSCAKYVVLYNM